jgi:hypothetical protein
LLNSMEGLTASPDERQALSRIQMTISASPFDFDSERRLNSFARWLDASSASDLRKSRDVYWSCVNRYPHLSM